MRVRFQRQRVLPRQLPSRAMHGDSSYISPSLLAVCRLYFDEVVDRLIYLLADLINLSKGFLPLDPHVDWISHAASDLARSRAQYNGGFFTEEIVDEHPDVATYLVKWA